MYVTEGGNPTKIGSNISTIHFIHCGAGGGGGASVPIHSSTISGICVTLAVESSPFRSQWPLIYFKCGLPLMANIYPGDSVSIYIPTDLWTGLKGGEETHNLL